MSQVYRPIVVNSFEDVIIRMREGGEVPYYMHGHPIEIVANLKELNQSPAYSLRKYPLIALFQDFDETVTKVGVEVSLNIIIANITKPTYKAKDRYIHNFEPVLYPLLTKLEKAITRSNVVEFMDDDYTKTDRLYWGRQGLYGNDGNIFDDHIDAIEINNLNLRFKNICKL